ncbi:thiol-activated cytolysin family protein [Sphingobacterium thalpophilum]|uniref:Thiol-activated cytolysin n=1 Tax=Sphingobacterium thalpophilum TaxID=259 RepID=A0A4U9UYS5_9SPHI|nr:thiol-activated cytolysin family protein [Sphingobacterium thalpophilum]VTR37542.1 Thiol-activated cytolysin [Sphingobacterium thalpophilum]
MNPQLKGYRTSYVPKARLYYFCLLLVVWGCSKGHFDVDKKAFDDSLKSLKDPKLDLFTVNTNSFPRQFSNQGFAKKSSTDTTLRLGGKRAWVESAGNEVDTKGAQIFLYQKYKAQMFTIVEPEMSKIIYPGSIIDGRSVDGPIFEPKILLGISDHIRPVTISTSMPVSPGKVAYTNLPRPTAERALFNAALSDLEKLYPDDIGAAKLDVDRDTFRVYEELKTLYGFNKKIDAFLVDTKTIKQGENHMIASKSAMKIRFAQENFTIDVEDYNGYDKLFDPRGLDIPKITGGVTPLFVKSVTYGRMGIMVIESSYSSEKLYKAVYKQIDILKGLVGLGKDMTDEEKQIINEASIRVKYTGIGTDSSPAEKIQGLAGFIQTLTANSTYSKENPGVPIAFQLALLKEGNELFAAPFQINYGPFDKPYVRIEYRNFKQEDKKPGTYQGNSPSSVNLSRYIARRATAYLACYRDPAATLRLEVPNFLEFKYDFVISTKSKGNFFTRLYGNGEYSQSKSFFLKNYGFEAPIDDILSEKHYYQEVASSYPTSFEVLLQNRVFKLKPNADYYYVLPESFNDYEQFERLEFNDE